jgi:hypothetical protein
MRVPISRFPSLSRTENLFWKATSFSLANEFLHFIRFDNPGNSVAVSVLFATDLGAVLFGTVLKATRRPEAESGTYSLIPVRFGCFVISLRAVGVAGCFSQGLARHWRTGTFAGGF